MSNHLEFIDSYAQKMVNEAVRPMVGKRVVQQPVIENDDSFDDDEFLTDNGWTNRRGFWVDPITKDRLDYEVAYAVQKERYRLDEQIHTLMEKASKKEAFFQTKIKEAAEIIKNQEDRLLESEEQINMLSESIAMLKEKPKAPKSKRMVEKRTVSVIDTPTPKKTEKMAPVQESKVSSVISAAAEILGDEEDNPIYDSTYASVAQEQAVAKFTQQQVYNEAISVANESVPMDAMTEEQRIEMEAMRGLGSGAMAESALTSESVGVSGAMSKMTVSPPNINLQNAANDLC